MRSIYYLTFMVMLLGLVIVTAWPSADLAASGLFFDTSLSVFPWTAKPAMQDLNELAVHGARVLGLLLLVGVAIALIRHSSFLKLSRREWAFLLIALLVGPGLVANLVLKDYWGRARPHDVREFAGDSTFTPALVPTDQCDNNCSFVAGDGSFGFYLTAFGFIASAKRRRGLFWVGMAAGAVFGGARLMMGAHFLSDVLFSALVVIAINTLLYMLMFGRSKTLECWQSFCDSPATVAAT